MLMPAFPEAALIEAGFLRRRCSEPVSFECPTCGTVLPDVAPSALVDLNSATRDELDRLLRIGDVLLERIIQHRPFNSVEDLKEVKGITDSLFKRLEFLVSVRTKDTVQEKICPVCMMPVPMPVIRCNRCKEPLHAELGDGERDCLSVQAFQVSGRVPAFAPEEPLWAYRSDPSAPVKVAAESELRRQFRARELDDSILVQGQFQADFIRASSCQEFRDVARPRPAPPPHSSPPAALPPSSASPAPTARAVARPMAVVPPVPPTIASPSIAPAPHLPGGIPPSCPAPLPAPSPLPVTIPGPTPPTTGLKWVPALIAVGACSATYVLGKVLDRMAFLGSRIDNMAATLIAAAFISFVLYSLACGARGNQRIFLRALVIGGLLWIAIGAPMISSVADPKEGSRVLVHTFPLSYLAKWSDDDRKALIALSVFVMPLFAGVAGRGLASLGAWKSGITWWSLLPIYVMFIGLGLACVFTVRLTGITQNSSPRQVSAGQQSGPAPVLSAPSQPKTATINLVSSESGASFLLSGPETLAATGSAVFSNVPCGSYKIVASLGGDDFESKIEVGADRNHPVEYKWENLKIRVESPEELTLYLNQRVLGTNAARIRAPVGQCTLVLRGEGKTKVRVYTPGTDMNGWTEETYKCSWHAEAPLELPEGQQVVHHKGVLRGFVYGAGDLGKSTYDLFIEREPTPLAHPVSMNFEDFRPSARLPKAHEPTPLPMARFRTNSLGQVFVPVEGTSVLFSIYDTRVKDYAAYAAANKGVDDSWRAPDYRGVPVTPDETCPVVNVSWEDAVAYCAWLTTKERAEGQIGLREKYRLPTDAEWSVAVGLVEPSGESAKAKDSRIADVYPWGREWPPPAGAGNYADSVAKKRFPSQDIIPGYEDGYATTSPVGRFRANQSGLFDMGGNVWQWCDDYFDSRKESKVLRGGAWVCNSPAGMSSSARLDRPAIFREVCFGFRVVLAAEAPSE